jgi:Family of unknown function (DUF6011)
MTRSLQIFEAANPDIAAWWSGSSFDFAVSLRNQVMCGKSLSERQMAAAKNCVAKYNASKQAAAQREEQAVSVDISAVERMLSNGKRTLQNPKVRLLGANDQVFVLSLAPAYGKNAGAIYVKSGEDYLGKIFGGKFIRAGACSMLQESDLVAACCRPEESAVAYGRAYGNCSCCGRELTNALSIELGIGPICREKFFG